MINAKKITCVVAAGAVALSLGSVLISPIAKAQGPVVPAPTPVQGTPGQKFTGPHPRIQRAMANLNRIVTNLGKDPHDFQGHKAHAMQLINQAISELNLALQDAPK